VREIPYTLIRSDRKTTAIRVLTDGSVEIRAPRRLSVTEIERFLEEKRNWVESHRQAMLERFPTDTDPLKILYKGCWKDIRPTKENRLLFDGEFFYAPPEWDVVTLQTALTDMMKKLARKELIPLTFRMAEKYGLHPERVSITGAKTKWGSCSGGKYINLSWRLMAAPPDTIAYVICHELTHLQEMNHGPAFWKLLESRVPDWRTHRERLAGVQSWLDAYYR